jgi:hypothetical protein
MFNIAAVSDLRVAVNFAYKYSSFLHILFQRFYSILQLYAKLAYIMSGISATSYGNTKSVEPRELGRIMMDDGSLLTLQAFQEMVASHPALQSAISDFRLTVVDNTDLDPDLDSLISKAVAIRAYDMFEPGQRYGQSMKEPRYNPTSMRYEYLPLKSLPCESWVREFYRSTEEDQGRLLAPYLWTETEYLDDRLPYHYNHKLQLFSSQDERGECDGALDIARLPYSITYQGTPALDNLTEAIYRTRDTAGVGSLKTALRSLAKFGDEAQLDRVARSVSRKVAQATQSEVMRRAAEGPSSVPAEDEAVLDFDQYATTTAGQMSGIRISAQGPYSDGDHYLEVAGLRYTIYVPVSSLPIQG